MISLGTEEDVERLGSSPMKILVVTRSLWPHGSGGELATYLFATLLARKESFSVIVLVNDYSVLYERYNFKIVYLHYIGSGKYSLYVNSKLLEKLVKWADIVYFASTSLDLIPLVERTGKPIVVHLHSYDPVCPVGSLYNFVVNCTCSPECRICRKCVWLYERSHGRSLIYSIGSFTLNSFFGSSFAELLNYADALIFVSNVHRDLFLEHLRYILGPPIPRTYVIYNPVPGVHYVPPSEFNVGYFGGLSPLKGYHVLLEAWLKIYRKHSDVKLLATKMGKLAGSKVLRRVNIIAYGRLDLEELSKLWLSVGIVVFPSIWQEPLPYVVIESLLRGKLLISSKVGGVSEAVGDAPGARLIPPGDVNALADALDWALSMDTKNIAELGLKNREYILKKFDSERSVRELIRVFEKVLSR